VDTCYICGRRIIGYERTYGKTWISNFKGLSAHTRCLKVKKMKKVKVKSCWYAYSRGKHVVLELLNDEKTENFQIVLKKKAFEDFLKSVPKKWFLKAFRANLKKISRELAEKIYYTIILDKGLEEIKKIEKGEIKVLTDKEIRKFFEKLKVKNK